MVGHPKRSLLMKHRPPPKDVARDPFWEVYNHGWHLMQEHPEKTMGEIRSILVSKFGAERVAASGDQWKR